jgi:hypothetical protein
MMRGHAYKRGATWTVVYDEPSPDGRRRQRSKGGFPTQKAAQRFLTDQLSRIGGGTYVEPARTTVADWCEQWLGAQGSRLRPSTWESYRDVLRGRVVPELGHIPLQSLTAAQIDQLYVRLLAQGRSDGKGGLSARSVRYTHTILRRALGDAVRKRLLVRNPTDAADPPSASEAKAPTMRRGTRARSRGSSSAPPTTGSPPRGGSPRAPGCGAARFSACTGVTWISTRAVRPSCRPLWPAKGHRDCRSRRAAVAAPSLSMPERSARYARTARHKLASS